MGSLTNLIIQNPEESIDYAVEIINIQTCKTALRCEAMLLAVTGYGSYSELNGRLLSGNID